MPKKEGGGGNLLIKMFGVRFVPTLNPAGLMLTPTSFSGMNLLSPFLTGLGIRTPTS